MFTKVVSSSAMPTGFRGTLIRHQIVAFYLIAYAGAWLAFAPLVLGKQGLGWLPISPDYFLIVVLATFTGPTLAAFVMTAVVSGKAGVLKLLRRYVAWRAGIQWYLFAIYGVMLITFLAAIFLLGSLPIQKLAAEPLDIVLFLLMLIGGLVGGPIGEEVGWRGFALPRLQNAYGPLGGATLVGILWGLWHLPLFLLGSLWSGPQTPFSILSFVISTTAFSIIMAWVFNNVRGSLLITMIMHSSFNSSQALFTHLVNFTNIPYNDLFTAVALSIVAVIVILLTRSRLSYKQEVNAQLL